MAGQWFEHPYPAGPPVSVPGFPRPLYPPDAEGYVPSAPGPDIEGYKRGISRLGRWPWKPFDGVFHTAFSAGKPGGNVGDSGVAGFQRQSGIMDTGYVGQATFDALLRARIPVGLPNAGSAALDTTALNLIAAGWQTFKGKATAPAPAETVRQAALSLAVNQIGYKETPRGSNATKFGAWYSVNHQPWCAMFVTWSFDSAGGSPSFRRGDRYAYCPYIVSDAMAGRYGLSVTGAPIPGDLVVYDWDGGAYDHVGIFESGNVQTWKAIEGNTSTGNDSNGGEVMRRTRDRGQARRVVFVRVNEPV